MIGYFSRRIGRLPFLEAILEQPCQRLTVFSATPAAVAGWGLKTSAKKARRYAKRRGIPYISLEDAFIRSVELGVNGSLPLGLAVDHTGIYYNANEPSDLENLIINSPSHQQIVSRAESCMAVIRKHRLSKYNHAPDRSFQSNRPQVLVVDQTYGDLSVKYGLGNEQMFPAMLNAAIAENPESTILVKIHPDVISGKKRGYLLNAVKQLEKLQPPNRCQLITEDCNPWSLFDAVEKVYTVSSQLGFEALIADRQVVCFGMPFYAGWGVTDDRLQASRRGIERTVQQIFYAAYLRYCRYAHPLTHTPCELEDILDHLILQRQKRLQFPANILAVGFSCWKRPFISDFLQGSQLTFAKKLKHKTAFKEAPIKSRSSYWTRSSIQISQRIMDSRLRGNDTFQGLPKEQAIAVWGASFANAGKDYKTVLRIEDGFLRSVGLGADLVRPTSLVVDDMGIYYDARRASRLEYILNNQQLTPVEIERAKTLREKIIALGLTKYNSDHGRWQRPKNRQKVILVAGQVESDASIALGSPQTKSNLALLKKVRTDYPTAYIIYKPHPDVVAGLRSRGEQEQTVSLYCDEVTEGISAHYLLAQIDELHTMTSLMGFEALIRNVPVVCYGLPFYAGWGLTADRLNCTRRTSKLTLEELLFGTLITYPRYFNSDNDIFIKPEDALDELAALAVKVPPVPKWHRKILRSLIILWAKMRNLK